MLVAPTASRYSEMTREFGGLRVGGAVELSAEPRRKRAREARGAFDVKKEVFAVGEMPRKEQNLLRKRFRAELVAVRGLLAKADRLLVPRPVKGGAAPSSSPGLAPAPRDKDVRSLVSTEADDGTAAKRRKTSPVAEAEHREAPKMTPIEKEQLAFRLAVLSAELSAQAVKVLQKQGQGHDRRGELEVYVFSMEDAALFELKMHLDKFVKTRDPLPVSHGKIVEDDGDHQSDECVDVCGGVSPPVAIAPSPLQLEILKYGDVFDATGLVDKLLSPLPQKYLALAEKGEEEYVDICGDASPVVMENLGAISRRPSISSMSDSDSDSGSDSGSDSDSSDSEPGSDSDSDMDISPAPAVPPMVNGDSAAPLSEPAPEVVRIAEPEKVTIAAPAVLPKVNGCSEPPSEPAPETVRRIAEPEKVSCPTSAVLPIPKVNGVSSLPSEPAPEVVLNAEPEKLPDQPVASPPARSMSELIAEAQEKRRQEERFRAREKARQELVETERSAMTSHRVHPVDMEELGIASVEHIVSQRRRHGVPPSLLEQFGLFLKADEDEEEEQPSSNPGVEDLEEGEFRS